jgi:O-antigen ligase
VGFGSLWDVDPSVQPSLQTDEWFAQPDAFTNEAHNGYIDILATTGIVGLIGAVLMLARWVWRALAMLRISMLSGREVDLQAYPFAVYIGLFPVLVLLHNLLESSYFTANATYGILILLMGIDIDLRWPDRYRPGGFNAPHFAPTGSR